MIQDTKIEEGLYQCDLCGEICQRPENLQKHMMYRHGTRENNRICTECGTEFYGKVQEKYCEDCPTEAVGVGYGPASSWEDEWHEVMSMVKDVIQNNVETPWRGNCFKQKKFVKKNKDKIDVNGFVFKNIVHDIIDRQSYIVEETDRYCEVDADEFEKELD